MIFANPLFLWGLLALAIPVAVHLFQFRRYKKVYFSNVDRLSELRSESRRQSELRRWLVLLMRCLAIIFLVLAFAQPTLPGKGQSLHSGATVISVYLDNSFSMENSSSDGNQLEMAKEKAREIVSAYRQGDRYQLLSNTMSGDEFRWLNREEFLDAVDAFFRGLDAAQIHLGFRNLVLQIGLEGGLRLRKNSLHGIDGRLARKVCQKLVKDGLDSKIDFLHGIVIQSPDLIPESLKRELGLFFETGDLRLDPLCECSAFRF